MWSIHISLPLFLSRFHMAAVFLKVLCKKCFRPQPPSATTILTKLAKQWSHCLATLSLGYVVYFPGKREQMCWMVVSPLSHSYKVMIKRDTGSDRVHNLLWLSAGCIKKSVVGSFHLEVYAAMFAGELVTLSFLYFHWEKQTFLEHNLQGLL